MLQDQHVQVHITQFLDKSSTVTSKNVALIILNAPIAHYNLFKTLYSHASYRICADGGANRLYDLLKTEQNGDLDESLQSMLPDEIHGDLDSLDSKVKKMYEGLGVTVTRDPDQYSTDFGKTIKKIRARMPHVRDILVHGSLGGRVDQGVGLLGELYREQVIRNQDVRFWLVSESSISMILRPGKTVLYTPISQGLIRKNIGILPVYGRAYITTTGLEWDVENWETEMGGQVSTSNHIVEDEISIHTDKDVIFTVELAVAEFR